jgi:AraC-like DNA-binding protein
MVPLSSDYIKNAANEHLAFCMEHETPPQVNQLAAKLRMSPSDFSDRFLELTGERPSEYLKRHQIEAAKRVLTETSLTMNAIAYSCAFGTRKTFYRAFKQREGVTPEVYRLANR